MKGLEQIMNENLEKRDEILKEIFCKKLKELRRERQLSKRMVAAKLNCAVSTYANWEQGRTEPSIYDIYSLLWVFEIEADELFDIEDITVNSAKKHYSDEFYYRDGNKKLIHKKR